MADSLAFGGLALSFAGSRCGAHRVRVAQKNLHRGKAWMRTSSPYVALPFDPGRVRPELVGLLLHPVSRSETWRRLGTRRTCCKVREAFTPRTRGPAPGLPGAVRRRAEKLPPQSLGGRVPHCRDEPIERKPNNEKLLRHFTRIEGFSQSKSAHKFTDNAFAFSWL